MWTSVKTLFISILLSSLLFGSHGKGDLERNTAQNITEGFITKKESVPLAHVNEDPKANKTSVLDPSSEIPEITEILKDVSADSLGTWRPTSTFSTSPPLTNDASYKSVANSSVADENLWPVSTPLNVTSAVSSENSTSVVNETMEADNSTISVSTSPPTSNTMSRTPLTMRPDGWLTSTADSTMGFTPYPETTTLRPTSELTNNSNFPNTPDPQEENRNTGVVFGAILGAILGASLLSLVGYLLCGKRKTDSFSHRRLYDDRNEPVLRLDNAPEPYDVSFGNSSYYNPAVNDPSMPAGQENARDGIPMDDIPPLRTSV
ncbi:PREDICTED: mucin-15 [Condylura cristata]|uniref:mucin-15 n=1 Tax=Condylura cristata TaxID=143302 RepID=UPI00064379CD|nr:PREDICTED: mucin-15 [Condylura cristata]